MKTKEQLEEATMAAVEILNKKTIALQVANSSKGSEAEAKSLSLDLAYQRGLIDGLHCALTDVNDGWSLQGDADDMSQDYKEYVALSAKFGHKSHLGPMGIQWMKKFAELKELDAKGETDDGSYKRIDRYPMYFDLCKKYNEFPIPREQGNGMDWQQHYPSLLDRDAQSS